MMSIISSIGLFYLIINGITFFMSSLTYFAESKYNEDFNAIPNLLSCILWGYILSYYSCYFIKVVLMRPFKKKDNTDNLIYYNFGKINAIDFSILGIKMSLKYKMGVYHNCDSRIRNYEIF